MFLAVILREYNEMVCLMKIGSRFSYVGTSIGSKEPFLLRGTPYGCFPVVSWLSVITCLTE